MYFFERPQEIIPRMPKDLLALIHEYEQEIQLPDWSIYALVSHMRVFYSSCMEKVTDAVKDDLENLEPWELAYGILI